MGLKRILVKASNAVRRTIYKPEGLKNEAIGPISRSFGYDRGTPIDRYYIENFLEQNKAVIKGNVLEIAESTYSKRFGSDIISFEVLHVTNDNPQATIVGDLTKPETLPVGKIDCFICTQTFNFIYDFHQAIKGAYQLLAPGGVLLATVAGISQIAAGDRERWGDYWRFTTQSAQRAFEEIFGTGNVTVDSYGNCLVAVSFLRGIAYEEIPAKKLDIKDADYPVTITIIARK